MRKRYILAVVTAVTLAALVGAVYLVFVQEKSSKQIAYNTKKPISKVVGKEHILLGAPAVPVMGKKWFEAGKEDAENPNLADVKGRVRYSFLLRGNGDEPMTPSRVFVQPQLVVQESGAEPKEVEGFSFRYNDHIQLMVDPTSKPFDIAPALKQTQAPNVDGVTEPYFKVTVRGVEAVAREAGVQKWEDGTENHYPAVIQWSEKGDGDTPNVLYTLMGDGPVKDLREIAKSLIKIQK